MSAVAAPHFAKTDGNTVSRDATSFARGVRSARFFAIAAVLGAAGTFGGCSSEFSNCEAHRECSGGAGTGGSSSGAGGTATSGGSESGGTSGNASGGGGGSAKGGSGGASAGSGGTKNSEAGGAGANGGAGGAGAESGQAGDGGSAGGSGCDTSVSPSADSCWLDDAHAIFVAPSGRDLNAGGRHAPVKTIAKAVELAGSEKAVIACAAIFRETVTLTGSARIYGAFGCPSGTAPWVYDPSARTVVSSGTAAPALQVQGATDAAIVIEDVTFEAGDGIAAGESSVAASVVDSADVTLRRVRLAAGKGADGENAKNDGFAFPDVTELVGNDATVVSNGASKQCACPDGNMSRGGGGGSLPNGTGSSGMPTYGGTDGTGGDSSKSCNLGGGGSDGASAPDAGDDAKGANTLGTLTSSSWLASNGDAAEHGAPGQGGGGGAGKPGGGGGGGGCGACGGKGGAGGTGGGASIALLSVGSSVALDACELTTSDAGNGGDGAPGQDGQQQSGSGGNGFGVSDRGCAGGNGGLGSAGGAGGGAAGGISVAVAFQGNPPARDADTIVTTGSAGLAGNGGKPGENDGIPGVAETELELP